MCERTCAYKREKSDREKVHIYKYFGCPTKKNAPTKVKTKPMPLSVVLALNQDHHSIESRCWMVSGRDPDILVIHD